MWIIYYPLLVLNLLTGKKMNSGLSVIIVLLVGSLSPVDVSYLFTNKK